ncbi:DUF971 domain-containing protein [bacterium]|nr:DUF971 domain-containing protein [bacterium]
MAHRPTRIRLNKPERSLIITWDDGKEHSFPWSFLRARCPSATEQAERASASKNPLQVLGHVPSSDLVEVQPVGSYALSLRWSDGHAFGIYTWEYLQELATDPHVQVNDQR